MGLAAVAAVEEESDWLELKGSSELATNSSSSGVEGLVHGLCTGQVRWDNSGGV